MLKLSLKKEELANVSDEEIFAGSLSDPALFECILERYQDAFLRKAESFVKDRDAAEDVVQEAFVRIYYNGASFVSRGNGSFKSWGYKILVNVALTHYKKTKSSKSVLLSPGLMDLLAFGADGKYDSGKEEANYVASVLSRMPRGLADVLKDFFIIGKKQEEIARENGLSVGAVKVRIYRAKESFREIARDITKIK